MLERAQEPRVRRGAEEDEWHDQHCRVQHLEFVVRLRIVPLGSVPAFGLSQVNIRHHRATRGATNLDPFVQLVSRVQPLLTALSAQWELPFLGQTKSAVHSDPRSIIHKSQLSIVSAYINATGLEARTTS